MTTTVTLDGNEYRRINDQWYDTTSFISVPDALARRLDVRLLRTEDAPPLETQTKQKETAASTRNREPGFSQEEVLPVIAEIIRERHEETGEMVSHYDIVDSLLEHPEGRPLAEQAVERRGHTPRRWAGWMVQAFSQRMSAGDSPYQDAFERARVDGAWAYRTA